MIEKTYLLDTNIVIKIWREYPKLLDEIEKAKDIDFKIHQDIAGELSRKEFKEINGVEILSERFIKLINHIIKDDNNSYNDTSIYSNFITHENNSNTYLIYGNKISVNDFSLIRICKEYKEYILVTEDKRVINSAKHFLDSSKIFTYKDFIHDLAERAQISLEFI